MTRDKSLVYVNLYPNYTSTPCGSQILFESKFVSETQSYVRVQIQNRRLVLLFCPFRIFILIPT